MSGYVLRLFGDPVLKQPARNVEEITADLVPLVHGMYETMALSQNLRRLIMKQVGASEIGAAAVAEGMLTLRMDGWLKVIKGIASLDQVVRETSI